MITRKICLLGAFAVGKTSLVRRFIEGVFDERYITTLGVKIDTKVVATTTGEVKLIVWDIEGADPADPSSGLVSKRMETYLQGAQGILLVADGTRPGTLEVARDLHQWFTQRHPGAPVVLLLNKSDLTEQWQVTEEALTSLESGLERFTTSALTGDNVERAFGMLAASLSEAA